MIGPIWDENVEWIYFYKDTFLNRIINTPKNCGKQQMKMSSFNRLFKYKFNSKFIGAIEVDSHVIDYLTTGIQLDSVLSEEFFEHIKTFIRQNIPYVNADDFSCKHISKDYFRELQLKLILN